jgi:hypothetical protein
MSIKLQLRRGLETDLPTFAIGEPGFCMDSYKLFIGSAAGNRGIAPLESPIFTGTAAVGETLGPELITNGSFTGSAAGWILDVGWGYASNHVSHSAGVGWIGGLEQDLILTSGKLYKLVFTTSLMSGGTILPCLFNNPGYEVSANGIQTQYITANGNNLVFVPEAATVVTIDDVSLREVLSGDLSVARNLTTNDISLNIPTSELGAYKVELHNATGIWWQNKATADVFCLRMDGLGLQLWRRVGTELPALTGTWVRSFSFQDKSSMLEQILHDCISILPTYSPDATPFTRPNCTLYIKDDVIDPASSVINMAQWDETGQAKFLECTDSALNPKFIIDYNGVITQTNKGRNLKTWWNFEDFINGSYCTTAGTWFCEKGGTGAQTSIGLGTAERPGISKLYCGTTTTGYAAIHESAYHRSLLFGAGVYTIEADIYIPALSTAAETYTLRFGFGDVTNADFVDGAYFEYTDVGGGTPTPKWYRCTASNSTRTKTVTTVDAIAGEWIRLKVVVNAAGTSVEYFINGVSVGVVTTNIPTGGGRETGTMYHIVKSAGTTDRAAFIDWVWFHVDLTTSR